MMDALYESVAKALVALREYKKTCITKAQYLDFADKCHAFKKQINYIILNHGRKLKNNQRLALERWSTGVTSLQVIFGKKYEQTLEEREKSPMLLLLLFLLLLGSPLQTVRALLRNESTPCC